MDLKMKKIKQRIEKIRKANNNHGGGGLRRYDSDREREKMRKLVFDELVKMDPDDISFSRPDSGSGIFEEESSDDMNDQVDDESEFEEEDDEQFMQELKAKQFDRKSRVAKSRHSRS